MVKCSNCNKKMNIEFNCKCTKLFCMKCYIPEKHNCSFDYKQAGKLELMNKLEKVVNDKVIKIV